MGRHERTLSAFLVGGSYVFQTTCRSCCLLSHRSTDSRRPGATALGTVNPSGGQAQLSTSTLSAGTHSITAAYSGTSTYSASTSSTLSQSVKATTTTTLVSSLNPSVSGQSVTFTAAVTPSTATGTVTFLRQWDIDRERGAKERHGKVVDLDDHRRDTFDHRDLQRRQQGQLQQFEHCESEREQLQHLGALAGPSRLERQLPCDGYSPQRLFRQRKFERHWAAVPCDRKLQPQIRNRTVVDLDPYHLDQRQDAHRSQDAYHSRNQRVFEPNNFGPVDCQLRRASLIAKKSSSKQRLPYDSCKSLPHFHWYQNSLLPFYAWRSRFTTRENGPVTSCMSPIRPPITGALNSGLLAAMLISVWVIEGRDFSYCLSYTAVPVTSFPAESVWVTCTVRVLPSAEIVIRALRTALPAFLLALTIVWLSTFL